MREAIVKGQLVPAGPDAPEEAICPACGGAVTKRKRRDMDRVDTMQTRTEQEARQRIRALVQRTKAGVGLIEAPRYLGVEDPIADYLGIIIKEEPLPLGDEGQYIPGDTPVIVIDPRVSDPDRLNFTFFHEISHHLICQDDELYSFIHEYASANDKHFDTALEHYCNVGAAEFLIPADEVRKVIEEQGFSIKLVEHLEPIYPASKPAIAIKLACICLPGHVHPVGGKVGHSYGPRGWAEP